MVCGPVSNEPGDVSETAQPLPTSCLSVVAVSPSKLMLQWKIEGVVARFAGPVDPMTAFGGGFGRQGQLIRGWMDGLMIYLRGPSSYLKDEVNTNSSSTLQL